VARLEGSNGMADRRLHEIERVRGLGHMLPLGNSNGNAKLLKCHCSSHQSI
jgi:hypothetical protein